MTARDDVLTGGWYAASDPKAWTDFSQKFQKTFGRPPPRLATLAYDAMTIAIELSNVPAPARYSAESLTRPAGFQGIDGPIRFKPDGRTERALAVLEIEKYGSVVLEGPAAPKPERVSSAAAVP